jgi:hypothetical protein
VALRDGTAAKLGASGAMAVGRSVPDASTVTKSVNSTDMPTDSDRGMCSPPTHVISTSCRACKLLQPVTLVRPCIQSHSSSATVEAASCRSAGVKTLPDGCGHVVKRFSRAITSDWSGHMYAATYEESSGSFSSTGGDGLVRYSTTSLVEYAALLT